MKIDHVIACTLVLLAGSASIASAQCQAAKEQPAAAGLMAGDIVDTAVGAGNFKTLAAALQAAWYPRWDANGVFAPDPARAGAEPFVIVMPPPNVTAVLHVGHGLNNTVQDVLIRWRRMAGDDALWVPGTDHAGIATQNVVEKQLVAEGLTRFDLGREPFVARVAEFVDKTGGAILEQLKQSQ